MDKAVNKTDRSSLKVGATLPQLPPLEEMLPWLLDKLAVSSDRHSDSIRSSGSSLNSHKGGSIQMM